jgi:hypothetical protein
MRFKIYKGAPNVATFVDFIDFMKRLIKDAKQKLFLIVANLRVHHPSFDTTSGAVQEGPELGAKVGSQFGSDAVLVPVMVHATPIRRA